MLQTVRRRLRPRRRLNEATVALAVRFGLPRQVTPISRSFGMDRGGPIDRYSTDAFLERHRADIQGRLLKSCKSTFSMKVTTRP